MELSILSRSDPPGGTADLRGRGVLQILMVVRPLRVLVLIHRWLSIPLCLLFVMWFASGIVMHFVPFPALTEAERFGGLSVFDASKVRHSPAEAVAASTLKGVTR